MIARRTKSDSRLDARRRAFLLQALSVGLLTGGIGWNFPALAQALGRRPVRLPEGQSIFALGGEVKVNGRPAERSTRISANDTIEVGRGGQLIAAVGDTAFIVREHSTIRLSGTQLVITALQATGRLLAVLGPRQPAERLKVQTVTATIGIRGTGFYVDAEPEKTYFCTCYGTSEIAAATDPKATERVTTRHHDAARWILAQPEQGRRIIPAPFINHTDEELMTIEALVGREVPFGFSDSDYGAPRREDY